MPTGIADLLWIAVDANYPATPASEQLGLNPCPTAHVNNQSSAKAEMGYRVLQLIDFYGAV
jgi:hypothetical protein